MVLFAVEASAGGSGRPCGVYMFSGLTVQVFNSIMLQRPSAVSQSQSQFVSTQYLNVVIEGDSIDQMIVLLRKVNINLERRDFSIVKRLPRRVATDLRPILVCITHPHTRESVLSRKADFNRIESCKKIYLNPDEPLEVRRLKIDKIPV